MGAHVAWDIEKRASHVKNTLKSKLQTNLVFLPPPSLVLSMIARFSLNPARFARNRSQRLACRILRELAREPLLIFELLNAGVAEYLSRLLPKLREISIDRFLEVR